MRVAEYKIYAYGGVWWPRVSEQPFILDQGLSRLTLRAVCRKSHFANQMGLNVQIFFKVWEAVYYEV